MFMDITGIDLFDQNVDISLIGSHMIFEFLIGIGGQFLGSGGHNFLARA